MFNIDNECPTCGTLISYEDVSKNIFICSFCGNKYHLEIKDDLTTPPFFYLFEEVDDGYNNWQ